MSLSDDLEHDQTTAYVIKGHEFFKLVERAFKKNKGQFFVYSWFRHGKCFYVGQSRNLSRRFKKHHVISQVEPNDVVFIEPCGDWIEAETLERCLITLLQPEFNSAHNRSRKPQRADVIFATQIRQLKRLNELAKTVYPNSTVST